MPKSSPKPTIIPDRIWEGNQATTHRAFPGIRSLPHSLSLTFRLSHSVEEQIYWTKVSIHTFVSVACTALEKWLAATQPAKVISSDTLGSINTFV